MAFDPMLLAAALRKHLLGAAPGPDEFAAALRYLSHTGYDPLLLAGDLRVMLSVDEPAPAAQTDGALTQHAHQPDASNGFCSNLESPRAHLIRGAFATTVRT